MGVEKSATVGGNSMNQATAFEEPVTMTVGAAGRDERGITLVHQRA
jgi:hypothetical protein